MPMRTPLYSRNVGSSTGSPGAAAGVAARGAFDARACCAEASTTLRHRRQAAKSERLRRGKTGGRGFAVSLDMINGLLTGQLSAVGRPPGDVIQKRPCKGRG